jgi:hypothetical protein
LSRTSAAAVIEVEPSGKTLAIPLHAHFIWLGAELPWVHVVALRSAAERGGFERVVLHHDQDLSGAAHHRALRAIEKLELRRLDEQALFERCRPFAPALGPIFARLLTPSMRKDLLRLAILYTEGGVYLDADTVTVGSLRELCADTDAFCGEERIVFPGSVRHSRNPAVRLTALLRNGVRDVLGYVPNGWAAFRAIERFYPRGVNNAVVASTPGGAFVTRALARIVELPPERQTRPFGIGPHLLQELAVEFGPPDLTVHPPPVFYPLGPEVSRHWFHVRGSGGRLRDVLLPETRVVHWYASVKNDVLTSVIDPDYVRANARRQLFSELALPFAGP